MAYKRNRDYTLDKERDLSLTIVPEGTPLPDHYCRECAHYAVTGHCTRGRLTEVGPLWEACAHFTTETPKPQDTMEKTETPTTKVCKRCGRELPLEAFGKTVRSKDGYQSNCRECQAELVRQGWEKRRAEGKAHPAPMRKKAPKETPAAHTQEERKFVVEHVSMSRKKDTPVAANPALAELPDHDLVNELRRRGYDVKCSKTIEL